MPFVWGCDHQRSEPVARTSAARMVAEWGIYIFIYIYTPCVDRADSSLRAIVERANLVFGGVAGWQRLDGMFGARGLKSAGGRRITFKLEVVEKPCGRGGQ